MEQRVYNLKDFGAALDGTTDDTAALQAACTAINRNRGGRLIIADRCKVVGVVGSSLVTFLRCNGVSIECIGDALIQDVQTYTGDQTAELFTFTACNNVDVKLRVSSQIAVTTSTANNRGLYAVVLRQGCRGVNVDLDLAGCRGGLRPTKAHDDPASYKSTSIRGRIRARGTLYPYVSQFGADDVTLELFVDVCGRNFFLYGSDAHRLTVHSKNQQSTSLIEAFNGHGCSDVDVRITDLESDDCNSAAAVVSIEWGDATVATHRNIRLNMNTKSPSVNPWGKTVEFSKASDGGGALSPDRIGRGHVLDGFELTGRIEGNTGNNNMAMAVGAFAAPDVFRRWRVHDLTSLIGVLNCPLQTLGDIALFENVYSNSAIFTSNKTNGLVRFIRCTATEYTATMDNIDRHEYIASDITSGTNQNYSNNKRLIDTVVPNAQRRARPR